MKSYHQERLHKLKQSLKKKKIFNSLFFLYIATHLHAVLLNTFIGMSLMPYILTWA